MSVRYVALFDAFVNVKVVPLVAVELVDTHQPLGSSKVTLVKLLHPSKAPQPMVVTLLGITMLAKLLQL